MPRHFDVPDFYRSKGISEVKRLRTAADPKRRDLSPSILNFGPLTFKVARHFGFCYGVENAIEIAYQAILENPGKRIFLLSEMIHNPEVNADLIKRGVRFLTSTDGSRLIPFAELTPDDIVIVPAFGTTVELHNELKTIGINPSFYDTTCPFVEKVWKRAAELGRAGFTVVVHGKRTHEETRATFSHSKENAPTIVVRDMEDTKYLIAFLKGRLDLSAFQARFQGAVSEGFDPLTHLARIGVVNQTTMLATETQGIAGSIREAMRELYGEEALKDHFANTKDTLCYATYENQTATRALIDSGADLAIVVGGYNSSNTSHLVELLQERMPTYYVKNSTEILSRYEIQHFNLHTRELKRTHNWLGEKTPLTIAITSGASCPDSTVDNVISTVVEFFPAAQSLAEILKVNSIT